MAGADRTFVMLLTKAQFDLKLYIAALTKDLQDVEDILQETNADIWSKADTYDPSRPFLPWAKTLAKFQVLRFVDAFAGDTDRSGFG